MTNQALGEPSLWAGYLEARVDAGKYDWDEGLDHIEREVASIGLRLPAE